MAATLFSFPLTSLPSGVSLIPATAVPAGTRSITLAMQRCTSASPTVWPNQATTIQIDVYGSMDGSTWQHIGAATAAGGVWTDPDTGTEASETSLVFGFAASPAYVKATATVANGPLYTGGTVTAA